MSTGSLALENLLLSDGRFNIEDYTEHFPENCQSWPNPNSIQVLLTLESALPLDWGFNIEEPTNHHFPENHPSWSTPKMFKLFYHLEHPLPLDWTISRNTFPRILLNTESIGTTLEFLKKKIKNMGFKIQDSRFPENIFSDS